MERVVVLPTFISESNCKYLYGFSCTKIGKLLCEGGNLTLNHPLPLFFTISYSIMSKEGVRC